MRIQSLLLLIITAFLFILSLPAAINNLGLNIDAVAANHTCNQSNSTNFWGAISGYNIWSEHNKWLRAVEANCLGDKNRAQSGWIEVIKTSEDRLKFLRALEPYNVALAHQAVESYPDRAIYYIWLGDGLVDQGETKAAIRAYESSLSLDETNGNAWFELGRLYGGEGNYSAALQAFDQTCIHRDTNKNGCPRAAKMYLEMGEYEMAISRYQISRDLIGYSWSPVERGMAEALLALGRNDEAIPHLQILAEDGDSEAIKILDQLGISTK